MKKSQIVNVLILLIMVVVEVSANPLDEGVDVTYKLTNPKFDGFFDGSTLLNSISIPQNVKEIGDKAFNYSSLETVYSYVEKPFEINEDIFDCVSFTAKLYVPYGLTNSYIRNKWTTYFYGGVFEFDIAGLVNASFDDNPDYNLTETEELGTYQEGKSKAVSGWTLAMTSPWCSSAVFEFGTKSKLNSKSIPSEGPNKSKSTAALGMTLGWGGTIDYYQKVKLSQGAYKLSYQAYNLNSESDRFQSNVKVVVDGVEYSSKMTSFPYAKWICDEIMFAIPRDIEAEIHVGGTAEITGSLNNAVLLFDDFIIENLDNSFDDLSSQDDNIYVYSKAFSEPIIYNLDDINQITFSDSGIRIWPTDFPTEYAYSELQKIVFNGTDSEATGMIDICIKENEESSVISKEYYGINGVKINQPNKGITIIREIMADGSIRIRKMYVK